MMQNLHQDGIDELDPLGGRLWTPEEVATEFRVSKETLRQWRREGKGPPVLKLAEATRRYPENGLIIFRRDNAELAARRDLAS